MEDTHLAPLELAYKEALRYLTELRTRPVGATATLSEVFAELGGEMPQTSTPPEETIQALARVERAGGIPSASGPRFFGYVTGGTLPVAVATDWMVSAWDQTASLYNLSPATAVAEEVAGRWLTELFGLPSTTSVGFPTGVTMAHMTALAAARHHLLSSVGWNVEHDGLYDAPKITLIAGAQRHLTIDLALGYLGFGSGAIRVIPVDEAGRMRTDALAEVLARTEGPTIVCAQLGDVNTGAIDPISEICDLCDREDIWVHVDGAFGMWAAASPAMCHLVEGVEKADSWSTDAHKWLNVPYDCGIVMVSRPNAHRAAMLNQRAAYLPPASPDQRDGIEWVPDFSRRARSLPVWAVLRSLGRDGVAELIERCCAHTRRFAEQLARIEGVEVLNDVTLNQALVRFGDDDEITQRVISRIQDSGECWFGGTEWRGVGAMRVSVVSWQTTTEDVDRSIEVIRQAAQQEIGAVATALA